MRIWTLKAQPKVSKISSLLTARCITDLSYDLYLLGCEKKLCYAARALNQICVQLDDGASNSISFVMRC